MLIEMGIVYHVMVIVHGLIIPEGIGIQELLKPHV